ncbi:MAG: helix-turn-helix domain-containing protein [Chloroflexaceae bacterium]
MRGPQPPAVTLSDEERQELDTRIRRHTTSQQIAQRARIVVQAADGHTNGQIARNVGLDVDTVRRWRMRWIGMQAASLDDLSVWDCLTDAPRPGRRATITLGQQCQIIALACELPETTGRPITQWTGRERADAIIARGILPTISPRHAGRLVKKEISSLIEFGTG